MVRDWCSQHGAGLRIAVQVMPNAGKSEVLEEIEGALKIRLKALPIEGRANEALVRFIADLLDVPKSRVSVTHGLTSRLKLVEVESALDVATVKSMLLRSARNKPA
jgi:uncharacterized protein YggU (UPF0235/DUF167 family)